MNRTAHVACNVNCLIKTTKDFWRSLVVTYSIKVVLSRKRCKTWHMAYTSYRTAAIRMTLS